MKKYLPAVVALLGMSSAVLADANVSVIHGIPGLPVDVYVNESLFLNDFQPDTVTAEVTLPKGQYKVQLTAADATSNANPVLETTLSLKDNDNFSVVAHLTEQGTPTITPFRNQVGSAGNFSENIVLRHTAAAPAVDVIVRSLLNPLAVKLGLANGNEETGRVERTKVLADVLVSGTATAVIKGAALKLNRSRTTILYVIGDPAQGTLKVLAEIKPISSLKLAVKTAGIKSFLQSLAH